MIAGVGLLVRNNLDRIGPLTLLAALLLAAAVCYATALRTRQRGESRSLAGDYVLLLGALLLSAAVGYAEVQFRLFGAAWSRHLLLLAVVHAFTAYALDSRLVLSAALTAFAGWLGIATTPTDLWRPIHALTGFGWRALLCAAVFLGARLLHVRLRSRRAFFEVFDHFAANLAFLGSIALLIEPSTRWIGVVLLALLAATVGIRGVRQGRELFVLYAIGYATYGLVWLEARLIVDRLLEALVALVTLICAVALLWRVRSGMKGAAA